LFDAAEWRAAVAQAGLGELRLIRFSASELKRADFKDKLNVLSYRWKKKLLEGFEEGRRPRTGEEGGITCAVLLPGQKEYTECKKRVLPVDALDALKSLESGEHYLWVDFLCHLDVPSHKGHVLEAMGPLYRDHTVRPYYLVEYAEAMERLKEVPKEEWTSRHHQDAGATRIIMQSALRRGWIQQEVGYGKLHGPTVRRFLQAAMAVGDYGSITTLVRRRPSALRWIMTEAKSNLDDVDIGFETSSNIYTTLDILGVIEYVPELKPACSSSAGGTAMLQAVCRVLTENNARDPPCELVSKLSGEQTFDPAEIFDALMLLRSYAESELGFEDDACYAMTQSPALQAKLSWAPSSQDGNAADKNMEVLRMCWETLLKSRLSMEFKVRRFAPETTTLGLGWTQLPSDGRGDEVIVKLAPDSAAADYDWLVVFKNQITKYTPSEPVGDRYVFTVLDVRKQLKPHFVVANIDELSALGRPEKQLELIDCYIEDVCARFTKAALANSPTAVLA